ncbi:methyltransferase domain-containing protein [Geomonas edaphica]|uniref:methyltransferase domain-containing protein n=1 Tax=Geomonas edaphica TaxID=2570226 RepID=UPI0018E06669|nr:methyltransferase domain-containing protein [Geomonas edaphica]
MSENENSITERLIASAGIAKGMRVLDIGCGNGVVSFLLLEAVGPEGEVIGIDINGSALEMAKHRAQSSNVSNVKFCVADISAHLPELGVFDAAFGRRVLMYLQDPVSALKNISSNVKSGGVVAFQESDSTITPARITSLPLHEKVNQWIWRTVEREGGNLHMGFELPTVLTESGFIVENVKAEAIIQGQKLHYPFSTVVRAILPRIVEQGIATEAEIDIDTLEQRLKEERPKSCVFISDLAFSVLARKP